MKSLKPKSKHAKTFLPTSILAICNHFWHILAKLLTEDGKVISIQTSTGSQNQLSDYRFMEIFSSGEKFDKKKKLVYVVEVMAF